MASYYQRPMRHAILDAAQKVVIVEGARAVGKTSMARKELEPLGFSYYSLADAETYEIANSNPAFWVGSISHPAIIDEAQRIKGLTLAIKEYVDNQPETGIHFILTGSASIGKAGLDGQDPLTRRSQRFTLNPLTQREITGNTSNLVDDLWEGNVDTLFQNRLSDSHVSALMTVGGFPYYVSESIAGRIDRIGDQVCSDLRNILGDTVLPDERLDQAIANSTLNRLLSLPGDILNVSNVGKEIGCDSRTVERYISIFSNRFLIRYLPNLRQLPQKQSFTRAKIHPLDTSFSTEILRERGRDPFADRSLFGKILESYVVSQIVPDAQWARHKSDCYYWREPGKRPQEVDLVLLHNSELLGIEVKASKAVSLDDFAGLRALAADERFQRGYLVYMGEKVMRVSDKLCAIPLSALWDPSAFTTAAPLRPKSWNHAEQLPKSHEEPVPMDASLFLSYCHADNDHLDNAMVQLAEEIAKEYEYQFGSQLQIFIDRKSLQWGDDWQAEINKSIEETHFLLPCVTPRYIRSTPCREEYLRFLNRTEQDSRCRILGLVWQDLPTEEPDQVWSSIKAHQYENVGSLRDLSPSEKEYKQVVRHLVREIRSVIDEPPLSCLGIAEKYGSIPSQAEERGNEDGLFEKMDAFIEKSSSLNSTIDELKSDFEEISCAFGGLPAPNNIAGGYTKWAINLAERTKRPLIHMNGNLDQINTVWKECFDLVAGYIQLGRNTNQDISGILPALYSLKTAVSATFDRREAEDITRALPMLSSRLRPLSAGLKRLLDTFRDIEEMTDNLIRDAEAASSC